MRSFLAYLINEIFAFQVLSCFLNFFVLTNMVFFMFSLVSTGYVLDAQSVFLIIFESEELWFNSAPIVANLPNW